MKEEKKLNLPQSLLLLVLIIFSVAVCIRLKTGGPMIGLFASWIFIYLVCKIVRIPYDNVFAGGEMIICRHLIGCFVGQFDREDSFGYLCCGWIAVLIGSVYCSRLRVGGIIHRVHCPHCFPQLVHRYKMENPKTN